MKDYKVIIVGAGPGGLAASMILAHRGYDVLVVEKESSAGGRNKAVHLGPYIFDTGPTFFMMPFVLDEIFGLAGLNRDDYIQYVKIDPIYKLSFDNSSIYHSDNRAWMQKEIVENFPHEEKGLAKFYKKEKIRYDHMYPCLKRPYSSLTSLFAPPLMKALPYLSIGKSLHGVLREYFSHEKLIISFTFQSKYLGMSPWECPGAFGLIPYIEHEFGIFHVPGGLSNLAHGMYKAAKDKGVQFKFDAPVDFVECYKKRATGVVLKNGEFLKSDVVVINADFGHAMENLFRPGIIKKWSPKNLRNKIYSCSTFMLYLGLNKCYNEPHHNIVFAKDYKKNVEDIVDRYKLSDDFSFYIRNASVTDPSLAPASHSALYVLVPVPNQKSGLSWSDEERFQFRDRVIESVKRRTSMHDIDKHIVVEKTTTPRDWELEHSLFLGATFNLGHNLRQMLYFRPHNRFEEVKSCYLVGGGTHPGSGLPTIYESARISSDMIAKDFPIG